MNDEIQKAEKLAEELEWVARKDCAEELYLESEEWALAARLMRQGLELERGSWINADDVRRLARELDVAMNGEEGAAKAPALCDVVAQAIKILTGRPHAWAVEDMDGGGVLHSVHLSRNVAEKMSFGLGNVVPLRIIRTEGSSHG
jgi:hypothetical protein